MKKLTCFFLFIFPFFSLSQTVVTLSVNQPPEFGFDVTTQDTTIVRGDSIALGTDIVVFGGSGEYIYSWSSGETLSDSTVPNPIAYPEDTTMYYLTVQDSYGCSFTISYNVNVQLYPTGISSGANANSNFVAKLFPNPNDGRFKVQMSGAPQEKIDLVIMDNSGRTIKRRVINKFMGEHTETIQMKLPNGIYTLLIHYHSQTLQRQFIIK